MKAALKALVMEKVLSNLDELTNLQAELSQSLTKETKSTSGDKHETGRAMVHLEMEKLQHQLQNWQRMRAMLDRLDTQPSQNAVLGSLVHTNQGKYYISVGLGSLEFNGQTIFCLAPTAPLVQKMLGKSEGFHFDFNGKEITIAAID